MIRVITKLPNSEQSYKGNELQSYFVSMYYETLFYKNTIRSLK